jgi:hypothetical protein
MTAVRPLAAVLEEARREARAELWRRREVWPLLELYLDAHQLEDIRRFMEGGDAVRGRLPQSTQGQTADWCDDISRQRGKSWKWTVFAVVWCHCHPGQAVKYLAQYGTSVRGIIAPTIATLIEDMPREYRPKERGPESIEQDKVDHKWHFPHPHGGESVLHAAGANNQHYKALRGPWASLLIQDECGFYDDFEGVQRALRPMLITRKGVSVYATTPPESPAHPYETTCQALKAARRYVHRTIHEHPRLTAEEVDNILLGEARRLGLTLAQFKRTTYYRREFLCLHVTEETRAVVPEWNEVVEEEDLPEGLTLGDRLKMEVPSPTLRDTYTSADFGFTRHPSAVLFSEWHFDTGRLVVVDETPPLYRTRTDMLAKAYREKCRELWPSSGPRPFLEAEQAPPDVDGKTGEVRDPGGFWLPYMALGDKGGRGGEVLTELAKEHGLAWTGALKEGDLEVMVNDLRRMVGAGKLVVHPRCAHLLKQLATGLWADKQKTDFAEDSTGHLDHLAALVYLVRAVDRQRNPYPVGWGADPYNDVVVHSQSPRGSALVLEDVFS